MKKASSFVTKESCLFNELFWRIWAGVWIGSVLFFLQPIQAQVPEDISNGIALEKYMTPGSRDIYIPAGRYVTKKLKLADGTHLYGDGNATILVLSADSKEEYLLDVGHDCIVENLALTGEDRQVKVTANEEPCLIRVDRKSNVTLRNIHLSDYGFTGIGCWHSKNIWVIGNFLENMNEAIRLRHCDQVKVLNNTVIEMRFHGIEFWGNTECSFIDRDCSNLIISGNIVKNGGNGAIWGAGSRRVLLNNNIVDGANDVGLDLEFSEDSTIHGNTVRNCLNGGISLFFSCRRIALSGNTVLNDRPVEDPEATWWIRSGIWLTYPNPNTYAKDFGHREVAITGNTLFCGEGNRRGIFIGSGSDHIGLNGNLLNKGGIWYGGEHNVNPMVLTPVKNNSVLRQPYKNIKEN